MTNKVIKIIQSLVVAYFLSSILLIILALVAYKTGMSAKVVTWGIYVIYVISSALAGIAAGVRMKNKKTIWGSFAGLLYYCIILFVSLLLNKGISSDTQGMITSFVMCIAGGFSGGFISGSLRRQ